MSRNTKELWRDTELVPVVLKSSWVGGFEMNHGMPVSRTLPNEMSGCRSASKLIRWDLCPVVPHRARCRSSRFPAEQGAG